MREHTLHTFTRTQHPVFFSMYILQYNSGTAKLLGKRGNIFPNSENTITLSQFLIKQEFTLKMLCSSLFQTGAIHRYPQCDCIQLIGFSLWTLMYDEIGNSFTMSVHFPIFRLSYSMGYRDSL